MMHPLVSFCLAFCVFSHTTLALSPSAPVVDLDYAIYQGTFNATSNITRFLGIRYAAPPVGKLRFQAPAPPLDERSLGVQQANTLSVGCLQAGSGSNISSPFRNGNGNNLPQKRQSPDPEDCLFLNVYASGPISSANRLPVLVWFHGGGYVAGNVQNEKGDDLINEAGGEVIVVTLDHRLGVFGFLAGSQVKEKGALNTGLLDQQAVLQWVQKNIHLFGGNSDEVTIWGQSAGAGSVIQHMIAHGGNTQPSLFKGAISGSLYLPSQYNFNDRIPEQIYSEFTQLTGCANATDTFECLVNVDVETLQAANVAINRSGFFGTFVVVPVVDGEFIQRSPSRQMTSGRLNGIRLLAMNNAFEGVTFVNATYSAEITITDYIAQLFPNLDETQTRDAAAQYASISAFPTTNDQAIAIVGESILICPTYLLLQSFRGGSAFKLEFAVPPATHGNDAQYYFKNGHTPAFSNPEFDASFPGAIMGFVKFGNPNRHPVPDIITPPWATYHVNHTEMLFNRTEDFQPDIRPISTDRALMERCAFWRSVSGHTAQ
ncbi:cephalosporin esterase [Irpex rosettiformis]|uniref:Cephalosporin esterase n=1 Tax=Irpex rosettiformis TaxID=378272 RepID=A0ACB8UIV3_9APHY|nr:cephalosporin esterase [Irpex rosettiformis]